MSEKKCYELVKVDFGDRKVDLQLLFEGGEFEKILGRLEDYALSFDFVAAGTSSDQREAYFRYQLSWGGPSDEFRFFVNPDLSCHRIEYWFLDWFDGAHVDCTDDFIVLKLWYWLCETGQVSREFSKTS